MGKAIMIGTQRAQTPGCSRNRPRSTLPVPSGPMELWNTLEYRADHEKTIPADTEKDPRPFSAVPQGPDVLAYSARVWAKAASSFQCRIRLHVLRWARLALSTRCSSRARSAAGGRALDMAQVSPIHFISRSAVSPTVWTAPAACANGG